ncbi:hypothetical protein PsYK624_106960 [Phanerochaete sordida]|uniref:Uncharacterized protein n=1 Tax=Phanerochaete sordida TaxID=48140 RepID=A0A9P3LGG0_9APHY|nr:hypothetical protein PsYK624_106960 [Phanerochaete sordida]
MPVNRELQEAAIVSQIPDREEILKLVNRFASNEDFDTIKSFLTAAKAVRSLESFRTMKRANRVRKHCVRCHGVYTDEENTSKSCVIPHLFCSDGRGTGGMGEGGKIYEYEALCCEDVVVEEEGAGNDNYRMRGLGFCLVDRHTEDPEVAAEDHNGENVVPCEIDASGKCTREYLNPNHHSPHFH